VLAVGTTTVRVLETLARGNAQLEGRTELFITPGFEFRRVDALLTNFHLPRSTLLALVMSFAGVEEVRELYAHAIAERYRFYSFGDAMLVL
jgi:S-adenosylmethionine:tRNA ribosyltransferase-isomerase